MVLILNPFPSDGHLLELVEINERVENIEFDLENITEKIRKLNLDNKTLLSRINEPFELEKLNSETVAQLRTEVNLHQTHIIKLEDTEFSYFCDYSNFSKNTIWQFTQLKKKNRKLAREVKTCQRQILRNHLFYTKTIVDLYTKIEILIKKNLDNITS